MISEKDVINFNICSLSINSNDFIQCLSAFRKNRDISSATMSKTGPRRYKYPIFGCMLKPMKATRHKCAPRRKKKRVSRRRCARAGRRKRRSSRKCGKSRRRKIRRRASKRSECKKRRGGRRRCLRGGPVTNNGYLNYLRHFRKNNCGLTAIEAVKFGAKCWCSLSQKQKDRYTKMACGVTKSKRRKATKLCRSLRKKRGTKCKVVSKMKRSVNCCKQRRTRRQ